MKSTLKQINSARRAALNGNTTRAQALLTRAAGTLGMGWMMWSSPMDAGILVQVSHSLEVAATKGVG